MLTFALLMSARMGIFQEIIYKQYGKHSKEALFYNVSLGFLKICLDMQDTPRMVQQPEGKASFRMSTSDSYFPFSSLGSTAYLYQASCFSPQTSTTTVCTSVKAVSPFPSSRKCVICMFLLADLHFLVFHSSCKCSSDWPPGAHNVALHAGKHHYTVSCQKGAAL